MEPTDILGRPLKVGQWLAYAVAWGSRCQRLNVYRIDAIEEGCVRCTKMVPPNGSRQSLLSDPQNRGLLVTEAP